MDLLEALKRLRVGNAQERLAAARLLEEEAQATDVPELRRAEGRELDHYVRVAIRAAIDSAETRRGATREAEESDGGRLVSEDGDYARGVRETTRMVVHEVRSLVGRARLAIAREVSDVEQSETASILKRLRDLLGAIDTLGAVAVPESIESFDLSRLLGDVAAEQAALFSTAIECGSSPEVLVRGDPGLVELVLRNALINACESTLEVPAADRRAIAVEWGRTDRDTWLAVLDHGAGLQEGIDYFGFAKSGKDGHLGVGLALAKRAATSLGGHATIENRRTGHGATFRLSWPQEGAREDSSH